MKPGADERVCVVIPMYRVAGEIEGVLRALPEWVWRVVVVDDASPDESAARALAVGDARVVLVRHETNQGVGGAVMSGFRKAVELGATVLVKMDGDGQMSAEDLEGVITPVLQGRADYAKGNRFYHLNQIGRMPWIRRMGNLSLSFLVKAASGYWNLFDPANGYVAMDAALFPELEPERIHRRYFFESSLLVELSLLRAVVVDVSMPARYGEEQSSLSVTRILREFPPLLLRSFLRRVWLQYFVLDFSAASLFLVLGNLLCAFGLIFGLTAWGRSIRSGVPATTGTVMLAAMPFILGFELLLETIVLDIQNVPRRPRNQRGGR